MIIKKMILKSSLILPTALFAEVVAQAQNPHTRKTAHCRIKTKNNFLIFPALIIALSVQAQDGPKPFVTTWETTEVNETITIPTVSEETYSYTVNWGDGNTDNNITGNASHDYADAGTHTITISGTFPRIRFEEVDNSGRFIASTAARQIRTIEKWGTIEWTSMQRAFARCRNLTIADDAGVPDLSNVTDMSYMFWGSSFNEDLSEWDVSNVKNMEGMFEISNFNGDISEWDVSKVTNMSGMFFDALFNGDISNWNTSKVTDMSEMFNSADFNQDISDWNVSSVTDMSYMFSGLITKAFFNRDISDWDVSKVTNMEGMFYLSPFTGDLSRWDVSSVTDMSYMFAGESAIATSFFNGDLGKWDISSVTDMEYMFTDNTSMSSENYDKLLIGWSTLDAGETRIPSNITFHAPNKYSCRGKAGRDVLTGATHSWTITDDELIPIRTDAAALPAVSSQCEVTANDLTSPTAKSSCTMGGGTTVTAAHDISTFPITESTLITWTYTHNSKSIVQTQTVTITEDTTPPKVTGTLNAITAACSLEKNDLTIPKANDVCDGEITATTDTSFPITTNTSITWTYTDNAGNTATQTQLVTITDCPPEESGPLGVADDAVEAVVVFPNPSGRYVEVRSPVEGLVRILSVGGEIVLESTTNTRVDAASLHSGLYLIQLPDGRLLKFIKR
ncbi:MAG: BspA family leucine-rich repeat surface protein [Ekhidna sp.]|nr:BspA family leucine-rich repeat surface protein [Ekhidna sp.]